MIDLVSSSLLEAQKLITPVGVHILRQIKTKGDPITFNGSRIQIPGNAVQDLLKNSCAAIFLAATIGPGLENRINRHTEEKELEKTIVLDAIGSEAAEAIINSMNFYLLSQASQAGLALTRRYSPGYGDLPLEFQKDLHRELSLEILGVSIDRQSVLYPRKTVTALIGVEE
jgi:cobalamin-dependent methionine synthase I